MKTSRIQPVLIGSIATMILAVQPPASQAAVTLSSSSGTYTQTFDTLATSGATNAWADDSTLTGWYLAKSVTPTGITSYATGAGTSTTAGIYSFGTGTNTDRALGGINSNALGNFAFGVLFQNTSGVSLSLDTFSFYGEQWRNNSNATAQSLTFSYLISSSPITAFDASAAAPSGWVSITSYNFTSPIATASAASLDGNAAANRSLKTGTLGITLPASQYIAFRWFDANDTGNDHALAIDDLSLAYNSGAASLYWDTNADTAGIGGSGTWDTTTSNWTTALAGDIATTTFTPANPVTFGGTAGAVTIDAGGVSSTGGIQFDTAGYVVGGGSLTLGSSNVTTNHATGTTVINSVISGTAGLQKLGAGTLEISAANTFSGPVGIAAGSLKISADANLGATSNAVQLAGGKLLTTGSITLDAGRSLTGSGAVEVASGQTLTVPGTINASSLTLDGGGNLALTGTTPVISALTVSGASTITSTNTITNGGITTTHTAGTVTISANLDFGATGRSVTVSDGTASVDMLLSGNLTMTGTGNRLTKFGDGTLDLTGTNSISGLRVGAAGNTPTNGGRVIIHDADDLGTNQMQFNAGTLEIQGGALTTTVGVSLGGGQLAGGATFQGSPITFQGSSSLFKAALTPAAGYQHKITANTDVTFAGGLNLSTSSGISTGFTIAGTGTVSLPAAANTITENITVDGAKLEVTGNLTGTTVPTISIINLAVLSGSSSGVGLGGVSASSGGIVAPGTLADATATLNVGNLDIQSTGTLWLEIGGTAAGDFDQLGVTGTLTLGGALSVSLLNAYVPSGVDAFTVILNDGDGTTDPTTTTFAGLPEGAAIGATGLYITYAGGDGNDVVLTAVPEPGSAVLLLGGLAMLGARRRRR